MHSFVTLPRELLALLLPFLTGFDLLHLSHAHRHFLHSAALAPNSELWRERVGASDTAAIPPLDPQALPSAAPMSWKQFYCTRVSIRFFGSSPTCTRAAAAEIHNFSLNDYETASFSFDLWFAMLPAHDDDPCSCVGGVVLGAQSEDWQDEWTPDTYKAFVVVTPDGDLQCSVSNQRTVVARKLAPSRWYHLALTFESLGGYGIESVYVDGEHVNTSQTSLASDWESLYYMQLATGFIDGADAFASQLYPAFAGWYDFNGVIDSFRFYDRCLTDQDVTGLAQDYGALPPHEPVWTLVPREQTMLGTAHYVRCARPTERMCSNMAERTRPW